MSHRVQRQVVSYVRRSSRMRPHQQRALDEHGQNFIVTVPAGELSTTIAPGTHVDWDQVFGRAAPRVVEIGPGAGENLIAVAQAHPDWDVIGFEVFEPAVASTVAKLHAGQISNVRVVIADGVQGLRQLFPANSLTRITTFFPDPWHKTRHHKRRLVNPAFAELVGQRLTAAGSWALATDWTEYAEAMRETAEACPTLVNLHDGWAPRHPERPVTKYEQRGIAAGRIIRDMEYGRTHE